MSFIPVDDDTAYTLIGLLTLEAYGPTFTPEQQAELWQRNFPVRSEENGSWGAYWGERRFLQNLAAGVDAQRAGHRRNPNVQSIAAWTRADAWGYAAPGWPEKAAELAFRDSSVNHRRNGVYGTMFMAASIAAAFTVDDPVEALQIGLQEIPEGSLLAEGVRWAFDQADRVRDYKDAARLVAERYPRMFEGHAINNALHVVFGILLGRRDFTRVIGETVAMGDDNDCTGATAGSIVGAAIGLAEVPAHWIAPFQGRMQNYLRDLPEIVEVDEIGERFRRQAERVVREG
jgi:ADP-ribosylglycohydrolase